MHQKPNIFLINAVKTAYGIDITMSKSRRKDVVTCRACVIITLSKYFGANTVQIAKLYGMDHSTVIYHLKRHSHRYRYEDDYAKTFDYLMNLCTQNDHSHINIEEVFNLIECAMDI